MNTNTQRRTSGRPALLRSAFGVVALLALAMCGFAQERPDLERARERWHALSPEHRDELKRRFEQLQRMSPEERARLHERFDRVDQMRRRCHDTLPESAKRQLDALPPEKQHEALRGALAEEISERGRRMFDSLPPEMRKRLEDAEPRERERMLEELKRNMRHKGVEHLERLARDNGVPPDELERMRQLPPDELVLRIAELERRAILNGVAKHGLPPFVSAEQWVEWQKLPAQGFLGRLNDARWRFEATRRRADGTSQPDMQRRNGPRMERVLELRERCRPEREWWVELAPLSREERFEELGRRLRERALEVLAHAPELVDAAQLAKLRTLHGKEFAEELGRLVPEMQPPDSWRQGGRDEHRPGEPRPRDPSDGEPRDGRRGGERPPGPLPPPQVPPPRGGRRP